MAADSMTYRLVPGDMTSPTGQGTRIWLGAKSCSAHTLLLTLISSNEIRNQSKSEMSLGNLYQSKATCTLQQLNQEILDIN